MRKTNFTSIQREREDPLLHFLTMKLHFYHHPILSHQLLSPWKKVSSFTRILVMLLKWLMMILKTGLMFAFCLILNCIEQLHSINSLLPLYWKGVDERNLSDVVNGNLYVSLSIESPILLMNLMQLWKQLYKKILLWKILCENYFKV